MIGREEELAELTRLLVAPDCRLITLVGLGGGGKTRLALAAAAHFTTPVLLADDHPFPDGCSLVDLSGVAGVSDAPAAERSLAMAIGLTLGVTFHGHLDWLDQLLAYLRPKRMLLILDGLERLIAGEGAIHAILREAPQITLLVTTRTRLRGTVGQVRELDGLAGPSNRETIAHAPASRLILHEAQRLNVRLTPEDWPYIARICRLVDGLPLALLITSGWLRAMSCAEIVRELEEGDRIFAESARRRATGHEGLRAIMASTWQALSRPERQALRCLAVFQGYFDRAAAEAIGVPLAGLLTLRDSSLLEHDGDDGYRLHQLVRRYAAGQLAHNPAEEARIRARHAAFYAAFLARLGNERMQRPGGYADIGAVRADLIAAWEWAVEHLDLGLIAQLRDGLATWFQLAGLHGEWAGMLAAAADRHRTALATNDEARIRVSYGWLLAAEANARMWQGELDLAFPLLDQARQCARAVGMIPLEIRVSLYEGRLLHYQGESQAAFDLLTQALTLARALQERRLEAEALLSLGLAAADVGDFAAAEAQLLQAQHHYRAIGDQLALGRLVVQQSRLHVFRAEYIRAEVSLEQGLSVVRAFGNRREEGWAHAYLGLTHDLGLGQHQEAATHLDRAHAIAEESGDLRFWTMVCWVQGLNALHTGAFDRAAESFARSLDYGRAADSSIAVGRALYGQGLLSRARGDATAAEDLARQAVRIAEDTGRRPEQATWLVLLGQAQEQLGQATAAGTFRQALTLARALPLPAVRCDAETGLAEIARREGRLDDAVSHATATFAYLQEHALAGCEEPGSTIRVCHRIFQASGDARAEEALRLGATLLERRLAALPAEDRPGYLSAFPARQEVLEAWHAPHALPDSRPSPPADHFPVTEHLHESVRREA